LSPAGGAGHALAQAAEPRTDTMPDARASSAPTPTQGTPAPAGAKGGRPAGVSPSLQPIRKNEFDFAAARHLLWRAGFGGTPAQVQTLVSWGPEKSVDYLLDFEKVAYAEPKEDAFDKNIMRPLTEDERREQRRAQQARDEDTLARFRVARQQAEQTDREQMRRIQQWWLKRMIETPRPLEEKLVLFWHGHFATSYRTIENSWHLYRQNQFFRKHATGNFADLLTGIIRDPAMLKYLNNDTSRKDRPNENLARELMELFSLGVGHYSEDDIKQGARALTGYTFDDDDFVFRPGNHDTGAKQILGASGTLDGDGFVKAILDHPECPRFITTKLYRWFAGDYPTGRRSIDEPARQVINELASGFGRNYEIKPVVRRLLLSRHFYDPALRNEQIKSPVQLVVGAVRSLNTPARDLGTLTDALNMMGQNIFFPPSVKGWDGGRSWINTATMFVRQNTLVFLLTGQRPRGRDASATTEPYDPSPLLAGLADAFPESTSGRDRLVEALAAFALGTTDPAGKPVLAERINAVSGKPSARELTEWLMLMTAMPEYQLC
jgi:uncharacterized protein (DUF1800 family)